MSRRTAYGGTSVKKMPYAIRILTAAVQRMAAWGKDEREKERNIRCGGTHV
jgi:hypothetical protein